MNTKDLNTLLLCAFRYALGRATYVTKEVADLLYKYGDDMPEFYLVQIMKDIDHAIEHDIAGHECDQLEWKWIRDWADKRLKILHDKTREERAALDI